MTRFALGLVGLLGILPWASPARAQATIGGEWREDVADFARRIVEARLTPGMGVAVSQGDWVLYAGGFGLADASAKRGVDGATAFYIGSTSKALTATAVVLLAAKGKLDLDAPIDRYIPGLEFKAPMDAHRVAVKQFLSMTDGLEESGPVVVRTAYTGEFTLPLLVRLLADYGPAEGGTAFDYDNLPYNILGMALAPKSDDGWKDVVQREVLTPAGMTGTSARLSTMAPERIAMPHAYAPGTGWHLARLGKADANMHAAGGHFATAGDLARFVAAHASGGMIEGRRVFPREAIELTHQQHADQNRDYGPIHRFGWGYGWDLGKWRGRTLVHRFGGFAGYHSHASFDPESGVGVVVLVNGDGPASPAADMMGLYIHDRLLGRENVAADYDRQLAALTARLAEWEKRESATLAERAARLAPLTHPLADFAGRYENPKLGTMTWLVVAGGLEARMGVAASRAEVYDAAKDQLRVELVGGGSVAAFDFPAGGGPAVAVTMNGERFERRDEASRPTR